MRGTAAVLAAATALFAGAANAQELEHFRRDTTCYSGVYVIYARGTFEPQNSSLSNSVANAIVAAIPNSAAIQVQYPANVSAISPVIGIQNAIQQITDYAAACPCNKMVLMGYSQGARVIGQAIASGNASASIPQSIGKNVVSVIQFGDPNRVLGQGVENSPGPCNVSSANPRTGAAYDQMNFYADRLDDYCASGDPVCCATGNDYGQHLGYFTTDTANTIAAYVVDKYNAAPAGCPSSTATGTATPSSTSTGMSKPASSSTAPSSTSPPPVVSTGAGSSIAVSASFFGAPILLAASVFI